MNLSHQEGYYGGVCMVLVGLLWRPRAGVCPNLPQRRSAAVSAAKKSAEYQRFFSRVPARYGSLWQIWTTGAAADRPGRAVARLGEVHDVGAGAGTGEAGGRGPGGRPVRPRRPRPSASAGSAQAPRSPGAPHHRPLNNLPGRLFRRRLSVLCDADHWEVGVWGRGPGRGGPGPYRPGLFTTGVGP